MGGHGVLESGLGLPAGVRLVTMSHGPTLEQLRGRRNGALSLAHVLRLLLDRLHTISISISAFLRFFLVQRLWLRSWLKPLLFQTSKIVIRQNECIDCCGETEPQAPATAIGLAVKRILWRRTRMFLDYFLYYVKLLIIPQVIGLISFYHSFKLYVFFFLLALLLRMRKY